MFLKISQILQENTCVKISFNKSSFLKRASSVFLWNLQNFKNTVFYRTFANDCFFRLLVGFSVDDVIWLLIHFRPICTFVPAHRNHSIDFPCKSVDWFLYNGRIAWNIEIKKKFDLKWVTDKIEQIAPMMTFKITLIMFSLAT